MKLKKVFQDGFSNYCILETNPFVSKMFKQYIVNVLHLRSDGQECTIHSYRGGLHSVVSHRSDFGNQ